MAFTNIIQVPHTNQRLHSPLRAMQEKVDDFFDSFFPDLQTTPTLGFMTRFPAINVSESENSIVVQAELSNMAAKDVHVTTQKNRILITGEKKGDAHKHKAEAGPCEDSTYYINEIAYGKFSRSLSLPFDINPNKTNASFNKGVLTITIDKSESYRTGSKEIPITTEDGATAEG